MSIEKILGYECSQCIKLYGHSEQRCAFCEEKAYYRDGLIEVKKMADKTTWNEVRMIVDTTLNAYASIIDLKDKDELSSLGNDIIGIIRDVYYNKKVEAN